MRIRTTDELYEKLSHESSWRKKDLLNLRHTIIANEKYSIIYQTLLRAAIPILYAHWEGFVKETSEAYFNFIALKQIKYKQLKPGLLCTYISERLIENDTFKTGNALIDFFENEYDNRSNLKSVPEPIKTYSNLNSDVLFDIMTLFDLDYEKFRGFENLIDEKLLSTRNKIAHGEFRIIPFELYDELHTNCISLIDTYCTEIINNAALGHYKRA